MRVLGIPYTDEVKQAETLRQEFVVEEEQFFDQQDSEEDIEELDEVDESSEWGEEEISLARDLWPKGDVQTFKWW